MNIKNIIPNPGKNLVFNGTPYCIVELGDILWFGPDQVYEVTGFSEKNAHAMSADIDLFELDKKIGCPVVMMKKDG